MTNTIHLLGMDIPELQNKTGAFRDAEGRVILFDHRLIAPGGGMNPRYFANPAILEAGSLGLSPVSGPWYASLDLGVRKSFPIPVTEESRLQLRFDFFNSLNRTNFAVTNKGGGIAGLGVSNSHNPNSPLFGQISAAFSPRVMQVGMKITF